MKREDLAKLNVREESINEIMAMHGRDIEKHKLTITENMQQIQDLNARLNDANEKLEGYIPDWQNMLDTAKKQADDTVVSFKRDIALENKLQEHGVKEAVSVKAHLNMHNIIYNSESNTFEGLEDQLLNLKNTHAFLFETDETTPIFCAGAKGVTKTRPHVNDEANNAIRALFGKE